MPGQLFGIEALLVIEFSAESVCIVDPETWTGELVYYSGPLSLDKGVHYNASIRYESAKRKRDKGRSRSNPADS